MHRPLTHWGLLVVLAMIWGVSFAFTSVAVKELSPATLVFLRNLLACSLLFPLALLLRRQMPCGARVWAYILAMSLIGNLIPFSLISWGQQYIDSALAGILMAVMPLVTIVLAHFFIQGETLTRAKLFGFSLGFIGILVLIGPQALQHLSFNSQALLGQFAVLTAAICYGCNTIIARRKPASDPWSTSASILAMGAMMTFPIASMTNGFGHAGTLYPGIPTLSTVGQLSETVLIAVAVLGLMCTGIATVIYMKLVYMAGPSFVSLINYMIPVWAVIVGIVFMGEQLQINHFLALALILVGVGVSQRK